MERSITPHNLDGPLKNSFRLGDAHFGSRKCEVANINPATASCESKFRVPPAD